MSKLSVAVLLGGNSAEAQVSRTTGGQIAAALSKAGHNVTPIELDQNCVSTLISNTVDVVFPALHGPPGEDGTVQGMLDMINLPYVGADVAGAAFAMDKSVAKLIFQQAGLPVLEEIVVRPGENLAPVCDQIEQRFANSIVVKPANQGSAIGVTLLPGNQHSRCEIQQALNECLRFGSCLVEPFVAGKEITVGVLEVAEEYLAHPVIEISTAQDQWYDYENRYSAGGSEHIIPAQLPETVNQELQRIALQAHKSLGLRDLSRADFIVNDEQYILLEVNTLPGMTPTSLYPDGAKHIGYSFEELVDHLVKQAFKRGPRNLS